MVYYITPEMFLKGFFESKPLWPSWWPLCRCQIMPLPQHIEDIWLWNHYSIHLQASQHLTEISHHQERTISFQHLCARAEKWKSLSWCMEWKEKGLDSKTFWKLMCQQFLLFGCYFFPPQFSCEALPRMLATWQLYTVRSVLWPWMKWSPSLSITSSTKNRRKWCH